MFLHASDWGGSRVGGQTTDKKTWTNFILPVHSLYTNTVQILVKTYNPMMRLKNKLFKTKFCDLLTKIRGGPDISSRLYTYCLRWIRIWGPKWSNPAGKPQTIDFNIFFMFKPDQGVKSHDLLDLFLSEWSFQSRPLGTYRPWHPRPLWFLRSRFG